MNKKYFSTTSKDWNLTFGLKKVEDGIVVTQDILPVGIGKLVYFLNPKKKISGRLYIFSLPVAMATEPASAQTASNDVAAGLFGCLILGALGFVGLKICITLSNKFMHFWRVEDAKALAELKSSIISDFHSIIRANNSNYVDMICNANWGLDAYNHAFFPPAGLYNLDPILNFGLDLTVSARFGNLNPNVQMHFDTTLLNQHLASNLFSCNQTPQWYLSAADGRFLTEFNKIFTRVSIEQFSSTPECFYWRNLRLLPGYPTNNQTWWEVLINTSPWEWAPQLTSLGVICFSGFFIKEIFLKRVL